MTVGSLDNTLTNDVELFAAMRRESIEPGSIAGWPCSMVILRPRRRPDALIALRDLAAHNGLRMLSNYYAIQIETRDRLHVSIVAGAIRRDPRLRGTDVSLQVDGGLLRCVARLEPDQRSALEEVLVGSSWSGRIQIEHLNVEEEARRS